MLRTHLTEQWDLRYPILGAPMAGTANGKLARAITQAGGLGQIGIGSETPIEYLEEESSIARGDDESRFGIGLMIWALERRPGAVRRGRGGPAVPALDVVRVTSAVRRAGARGRDQARHPGQHGGSCA